LATAASKSFSVRAWSRFGRFVIMGFAASRCEGNVSITDPEKKKRLAAPHCVICGRGHSFQQQHRAGTAARSRQTQAGQRLRGRLYGSARRSVISAVSYSSEFENMQQSRRAPMRAAGFERIRRRGHYRCGACQAGMIDSEW